MLSDSSTRYAVKNSSAAVLPSMKNTPILNKMARLIQKALHNSDSLMEGTWSFLWKTNKSRASMTTTKAKKPIQKPIPISMRVVV